ncbi:ribonuclease HI family protein [candidate division WOR-3 bacterium]|nr:ribonuclease HI family protein [candidate division WOR-3 bacterium]
MDRVAKVFIDGASRGNPGPSGIGILVLDEHENEIRRISEKIGDTTNNVAEYRALLKAVIECKRLGFSSAQFFTDSQLLARQVNGMYKIKDEKLKPLYVKIRGKLLGFRNWEIIHIPREKNIIADKLANDSFKKINNK